ncbi:ECF transporter S component [Mycoplasmoides alvi]|uniref:ECF transporter S component n=1 Tax=Mycoplasmoides alvi TaxID=78580 RepID=UPI00051AB633|nr:ECF transporter S component [Mycoplasmoides alvi]
MNIDFLNCQQQFIFPKFKTKKQKFLKFLFPYFPLKWKYSTQLIVLLAVLISFRLITQIFSLPIGPVLRLSVTWIPTSLIGWFFGPILGIPIGILMDSLTFFWSGGIWYWMYAIQEPLITCLAGIIAGIYNIRKEYKNSIWDYLLFQTIVILFTISSILILLNFASSKFDDASLNFLGLNHIDTVLLTISCISIFFIISEIIIHTLLRYKTLYQKQFILFIYTTLLGVLLSIIFSFILGTIAAINFYKYFVSNDNSYSKNFLVYGSYYYLIPRVIKETFKMPLIVVNLIPLIRMTNSYMLRIQQMSHQKW